MLPIDGSDPRNFEGVDLAVYSRGTAITDLEGINTVVRKELADYLAKAGIRTRECLPGGMGSAGSGQLWLDLMSWTLENSEKIATLLMGAAAVTKKLHQKIRSLKDRANRKIIDPYVTSMIVELCVRTLGDGPESHERAKRAFGSLLTKMPAIDSHMRTLHPDQNYSFRLLRAAPVTDKPIYVLFRVEKITQNDVAKLLKRLERPRIKHDGIAALLVYRRFGKFTAIRKSKRPGDFARFMSMP